MLPSILNESFACYIKGCGSLPVSPCSLITLIWTLLGSCNYQMKRTTRTL